MKEKKHNNGCNILIMTFANLEKYVHSKNCLKQRRQPLPPPPPKKPKKSFQQSRRYFAPKIKSRLATAVIWK